MEERAEQRSQRLTLLLTDVVDSTRLSEALGDAAMTALWTAHDRLARDLLPVHRGREIDKTDGFLLLFDDPADAVGYALAYHRALAPLGLKARAGLHVGPVALRQNPASDVARGAKPLEVDGIAKPVAARVMALALPGQTLLTEEAAQALSGSALSRELVAHGHWMLKGVFAPTAVHEVGEPGVAPLAPPPDGPKAWRVVWRNGAWTPVREVRHTLPRERDVFVGRDADLRELARRLDDGAALVSVLGIGGTGKTRLVVHYGWTFLGSWPGGVWFCDLSEARGVEGITQAVAAGLEVALGAEDAVTQLGHAIAGRGECVVVLDNFEQVARYAPETLGRWLDRAPQAQFVVTTREVLGLPGESALALAPLAPPDAVALFVERAQLARRDFVLTEAERPHVEALVKLLDALPLAIELAAARVRALPPPALLQRMSERFRLLASTGGRHTRQATLRGALDWSWELLSADEQRALAQLSVFEGGFSLEAAEAVLALDDLWPMDAVLALVDKSLVRPVGDEPDAARFDLLVSVQEYAAEKLAAMGGGEEAVARHAAHYGAFGTREAVEARWRHGGVALRRALADDLENLVVACRGAVARGDGRVAVLALVAATSVLELRGPYAAALELGRKVEALPGLSVAERATVGGVLGRALGHLGRWAESLAATEAALAPRGPDTAELLCAQGRTLYNLARFEEALAATEEALRVARAAGDRRVEGLALGGLGIVKRDLNRADDARADLEAALAIHREVGNRLLEGGVLANLALDEHRPHEAVQQLGAALAVHREVGNRQYEGIVLANLGQALHTLGRGEAARSCFEETLAIARDTGDRAMEALANLNLGHASRRAGALDRTYELGALARAIAQEVGDPAVAGAATELLGVVARARGRLDEARALHAEMADAMRRTGNRSNLAVSLVHLAQVERDAGRLDEARASASEALAVARAAGIDPAEGAALGTLGLVALDEGRLPEAAEALVPAQDLLRRASAWEDLGVSLCGRAVLEHRRGDPEASERALAEARAIADRLRAGDLSELGQELSRTLAVLGRA